PPDGSYADASPYISASYSDNNAGPMLVYPDGIQIEVSDYGSSFDYYASNLTTGTHIITVSDQFGNFTDMNWSFIVGWTSAGSLLTNRYFHTATLLPNGKVLVVGGDSNGTFWLGSAELYDPESNSWSAAGNPSTGRHFHTATLL